MSVGHLKGHNKSLFWEPIGFGILVPAATASFTREKQFICLVLEFFNRDLSTRVGLQVGVELIVLLYARFTVGAGRYTGTEFLKVHADPVEGEAASAVRTFNSGQC